ncbi:MAG: HAD family hydrolase [Ignavibacteria bacterium]|nr:HAD family hydrolase [Ignavibacteria bacterium]
MGSKAVFLDRDGTINFDPDYLKNPDEVVILPTVGEALAKLKISGYKLIVISNQSGVARGIMTVEDVEAVNERINELLFGYNVQIEQFYFCPHHPDFSPTGTPECRKPSPEMLYRAVNDHDIVLDGSYMIGDTHMDIGCGNNAGIPAILVRTGKGASQEEVIKNSGLKVAYTADNLLDAVNFILKEVHEEK